jgi:hypothetical protein
MSCKLRVLRFAARPAHPPEVAALLMQLSRLSDERRRELCSALVGAVESIANAENRARESAPGCDERRAPWAN